MWIRRLAIAHWRGLDYTLDGLTPGLNLIAGPNEAGKSRLVQALRFALFESTKGKSEHKRALATWGVAPEKPRVVVEFMLADIDWQLEKVFLGTGCNTRLRGASETLDGEAAELRLAELLGVNPGRSAELKPDDLGIWPLLWVDQGESRDQPAQTETSQSRIVDRLGREIGEAAAGAFGQRLFERAAAQYALYYSPSTHRPLKALSDPETQLAAVRERLSSALTGRDALAHTGEALAAARIREMEQTERLSAADARLAEITRREQTAQTLRHRLEIAEGDVRLEEHHRDDALARQHAAAALDAERVRVEAQIVTTDIDQALQREACATLERAAAAAGLGITDIEARVASSETRIALLRERERHVRLRTELDQLLARRATAMTLDTRLTEMRLALAGLPTLTQSDVTGLRRAESTRNTARARLDGASTSLVVTAHQPIAIDGELLAEGHSRRLLFDDDRRVEVDGVLSIAVNPGGGEIVRLRETLHDAERNLTTLLTRLGVEDVDAAEYAARRRRDIEVELGRSSEELARVVPEGIDELTRQIAERRAVLATDGAPSIDSRLETTPQPADVAAGVADAEPHDPTELAQAEAAARALTVTLLEARGEREDLQQRLARAREALVGLSQRAEGARTLLARLTVQRDELPDAAALANTVADTARVYGERVAARDEARRQFDASGGASLTQDLDQARRAANTLRELRQRTTDERIELTGILKGGSNQALHEQVLDLEAEVAAVESRLARVQREAAAAKRLYEVLGAEYQAARERLTQPVIERIRPYLADLFPGTEVWLDEALGLRGLRSADAEEAFEELSGGAREQLSLLVRIGLAEVLGADESWPLVLDDVLVNTDATRILRMQRVLFQAGRKMQILLFTCHGALFDALGPDAWVELPAPHR